MKLADLEPRFLRYEKRPDPDPAYSGIVREFYPFVEKIEDAQGVEFLCPVCFKANGGPAGTHAVICWSSSRGIPDDVRPAPGRWRLVGTGLNDLSLMEEPGKTRSVQVLGDCKAHFYVTNGEVT